MAARIRDELGVEAELVEGGGGIFDVHRDGERIYSKHDTGRFPEDEEVLARLRD